MKSECSIDVGKEFTVFPAGRYKDDGPYSGARFRDDLLVPKLKSCEDGVDIFLDGTMGYGSSFLEEAFGGLVRVYKFAPETVLSKIRLRSTNQKLIAEIRSYVLNA